MNMTHTAFHESVFQSTNLTVITDIHSYLIQWISVDSLNLSALTVIWSWRVQWISVCKSFQSEPRFVHVLNRCFGKWIILFAPLSFSESLFEWVNRFCQDEDLFLSFIQWISETLLSCSAGHWKLFESISGHEHDSLLSHGASESVVTQWIIR